VKMLIEPTISWGDIAMCAGLSITGILAFTDVSESVAMNRITIEHVQAAYNTLDANHREHLEQERAERQLMRQELREDLRAIATKLDRLIEGGIQ